MVLTEIAEWRPLGEVVQDEGELLRRKRERRQLVTKPDWEGPRPPRFSSTASASSSKTATHSSNTAGGTSSSFTMDCVGAVTRKIEEPTEGGSTFQAS